MRILNYWFSFNGRIGRAQWWLRLIGLTLIVTAAMMLGAGAIATIGTQAATDTQDVNHLSAAHLLIIALMILYLVCSLAIHVRRWHDLGKSGWWQLIMLVPFGGLYVWAMCGFVRGDDGGNEYGRDPSEHD